MYFRPSIKSEGRVSAVLSRAALWVRPILSSSLLIQGGVDKVILTLGVRRRGVRLSTKMC